MKRDQYQPGEPAKISAHPDGERWTLVFTRELRHAPEKVWDALTDPAELSEWAPFDADRNLGKQGDATLTMAGDETQEKMPATIRRAERPRLLEYTWGPDLLRWELEPIGTGTRLTLRHTTGGSDWVPKIAAGWHICIDVMDLFLAGTPVGRIAAEEAKKHGWDRLDAAYRAQLGL
jgi:uncharacterized protein YndB with AHSA1/START domain